MAYIPVAQRTGAPAKTAAYTPIAARATAPPEPGMLGETATSLLGGSGVPSPMRTSTQAIPDATTGGGLGGFLKDVGQGTLRDFVAAGIAVGNDIKKSTIGGSLDPKNLGILGPTLLGKEPIRGLTDTAADYQRSLEQTQAKKYATPIAVLGSVAPVALDFLGLGGETKGATALFKALRATEATDEGVAHSYGILKGVGFEDEIAKQYAEVVAKSKSLDEIKNAIMAAKKLQETTKAGTTALDAAKDTYTPIAERARAVVATVPGVKTAEELVQPDQPLFFGSKSEFTGNIGTDGLPTTTRRDIAERFADFHGKGTGRVNEVYLDPNARVAKFEDLPSEFRSFPEGNDAIEKAARYARSKGYDAIDMRGIPGNLNPEAEVRIFNPDVLKTSKPSASEALVEPVFAAVAKTYDNANTLGKALHEFDESLTTARLSGFDTLAEFYKSDKGAGGLKPTLYNALKDETQLSTEAFKGTPNDMLVAVGREAESGSKVVVDAVGRVNTKLEKMAQASPTFGEFYQKSGVTLESLNATARSKGYANAADFYAKNAARTGYETVPGKGGVRIVPGHASDAETASLERMAQTNQRVPIDELPQLPRRSAGALGEELGPAKQALEDARTQRDIGRDVVPNMPGAGLKKYESQAFPDELPEVSRNATSKFGRRGDVIAQELGFQDTDEASAALKDYNKAKAQLKQAETSVSARVKDYRDRKAVFDEVVRYVKQEGNARREKVKLVQDFFKLGDGEVKDLLKGERDVRLMNDGEFDDFMKRFEGKATESYLRLQDLVDLKATIFDKEFVKLDNLRQAMKLPTIENMTPEQMRSFNETLQQFQTGDEFLGVRQLETLRHTDINGIKTVREAREKLLEEINASRARKGLPLATVEDLNQVQVGTLDRYRYDPALARQNPLYELMVHETHKATLTADAAIYDVKDKADELFAAARKSRPQSILGRLIPTDDYIFKWLESPDAQKLVLGKDMTHEELEAAMYVRAWYAEARDYLVQEGVLKKYRADYVTHVRRGFLEAWYEEGKHYKPDASGTYAQPSAIERAGAGLKGAFKGVLDAYKEEAAIFNILNRKTGEVLPLEKFFQFSMQRTGNLVPTKNVASAFLKYARTFEKKKMLDSLIPKLDVYVHSLTPKKLTPRGLEFDDSLKRFFREWMNTKKGRTATAFWIEPGGKVDWALRTGTALTRILDLGLNFTVGIASHGGAQMAAYTGLGEKAYAEGVSRLFSGQGKKILDKYRNLVGESLLKKVKSAESTLGENLVAGTFGIFSQADRKAREIYLLGSMTPEEYKAGEVSADRLTDIALALGRRIPIENASSVAGKTAIGKLGTQYKTWAVPLLESAGDSLAKLRTAAQEGKLAEYVHTPEGAELMRTAILTSVVGIAGYSILTDKTPLSQMSFTERIAYKGAQDALSAVGALDPTLWFAEPRLAQFVYDLGSGVKQLLLMQENKDGELTGAKTLKNTLTPGLVRQILPADDSNGEGSSRLPGLPGLPPLPKLPKLPSLPKLPKPPKLPPLPRR